MLPPWNASTSEKYECSYKLGADGLLIISVPSADKWYSIEVCAKPMSESVDEALLKYEDEEEEAEKLKIYNEIETLMNDESKTKGLKLVDICLKKSARNILAYRDSDENKWLFEQYKSAILTGFEVWSAHGPL